MRRIIHVGLGKTGTTLLQNEFLPLVVQQNANFRFNSDVVDMTQLKKFPYIKSIEIKAGGACDCVDFISYEHLADWNPKNWESSSKKVCSLFGSDSEILLTLRKPKAYLTSLYLQHLHEGGSMFPREFFTFNGKESPDEPKARYAHDVRLTNFETLLKIYRSKFQKVHVLVFTPKFNETFSDWLEQQNLDSKLVRNYDMNQKLINRGFSRRSVFLTLLFRRWLGLDLFFSPNRWRSICQNRVDKIDYSPFEIDFESIDSKIISKNEKFLSRVTEDFRYSSKFD